MSYKIWCKQRHCYFADEAVFDSLNEVRNQLIDYHSVDCDTKSLNRQSLAEIADIYEWEIHDKDENKIDYSTLKTIN